MQHRVAGLQYWLLLASPLGLQVQEWAHMGVGLGPGLVAWDNKCLSNPGGLLKGTEGLKEPPAEATIQGWVDRGQVTSHVPYPESPGPLPPSLGPRTQSTLTLPLSPPLGTHIHMKPEPVALTHVSHGHERVKGPQDSGATGDTDKEGHSALEARGNGLEARQCVGLPLQLPALAWCPPPHSPRPVPG